MAVKQDLHSKVWVAVLVGEGSEMCNGGLARFSLLLA